MTFEEYQKTAVSLLHSDFNKNVVNSVLGLCGETGEVAEKVKKVMRDKEGIFDDDSKKEIIKELGDILWYIAVTSSNLGISLEDVAHGNIEKLTSRKDRRALQGEGDNR